MKKQLVILVGIIIAGASLCWWFARNNPAPPIKSPDNAPVEANQQAQPPHSQRERVALQPQQVQRPTNQPGQSMSDAELEAYGRRAIAAQAARKREIERDWKAQLSAPINFFGKVVDENEQPVATATAEFTWNDLPPESETTNYTGETFTPFAYMHSSQSQTTSDAQGLFSLVDKKGKGLSVIVSKAGYYSTANARQSFEFGDPQVGIFVPDRSNPVVFRLRKRGPGVDLVTSEHGMKDYLGVSVPRDGIPVQVNMLARKTGEGPLTISQTKPAYENWKQATEWSFRMEIPDGGFVIQTNEFPFEAPASGYQPVVEFKFQAGQTNWTTDLRKDYYIKFGNPPRYGRLHLDTSIMMNGARLTYAINPNGSRNLESQ